MRILSLLFGKTGKVVANLADDGARVAAKNIDDAAKMSTSIFAQADDMAQVLTPRLQTSTQKVSMEAGRYLRAQKPGTIKIQSHPTQQYLDDMLGVANTERASQVTKDGVGFVNRKAAADAHYAFTKGTHIEPVVTTSTPTAEVINKMHNVDHIDTLRRAEVTGELPASTLARRNDVLDAVENYNGEYLGSAKVSKALNEFFSNKIAKDYSNIDTTKLKQLSSDAQKLFAKADKFLK